MYVPVRLVLNSRGPKPVEEGSPDPIPQRQARKGGQPNEAQTASGFDSCRRGLPPGLPVVERVAGDHPRLANRNVKVDPPWLSIPRVPPISLAIPRTNPNPEARRPV